MPLILGLIVWGTHPGAAAHGADCGGRRYTAPFRGLDIASGSHSGCIRGGLWGAWDSLKGGLTDAIAYSLSMGWYIGNLSRYIEPLGDLYGELPGYEPFALSMLTLLIIQGRLLAGP